MSLKDDNCTHQKMSGCVVIEHCSSSNMLHRLAGQAAASSLHSIVSKDFSDKTILKTFSAVNMFMNDKR